MWAAGFKRNAQACQERHWWIHHKDIAVATNDQAVSVLEKAVSACVRKRAASAQRPRNSNTIVLDNTELIAVNVAAVREYTQAAADQVFRQCLVHALQQALRPRTSPASGLPALAQIQQQVHSNLLSLPPKLQEGFDQLRLDAEKVSAGVCGLLPTNDKGQLTSAGQKPSEVASNAAALADMLIATNTVHSFQHAADNKVKTLP